MADSFIEVPIVTDANELADLAIDELAATWTDWEPNDGDLEVVQIEALSQMAADVANVAAIMPAAAFEAVLERLFGVVPQSGEPAVGTVTFTLLDALPHTIPGGTEVDIDGYAFTVDDDMTIPSGQTSLAAVPVSANVNDTGANGLVGENVTLVGVLAFVGTVTLDAPTSGAVDPETEEEYLDRGSQALELQAITLVTARDYELMALNDPAVERATAVINMATRTITVTVSDEDGAVVDSTSKTRLAATFDDYRQTTWVVVIGDPTVTTINVTFQVHLYPGFDSTAALDNAKAVLIDFLDPSSWGSTQTDQGTPTVEPRVRKNKLIDLIGDATGVDYVIDLTITGSAGSVQTNGDWLMPGAVPVPKAGPSITGSVA
jgi:hypothetical protein